MRKKFLTVLLTSALVASALTGCGDKKTTTSSQKTSQESSVDDSNSADQEESSDAEDSGDVEESSDAEDSSSTGSDTSWADNLSKFYAGITDDEGTYMYLAFGNEGTFGMAMFYNVESAESGSWVGECTNNGDGTLTISDQNNGTSLTMGVEEAEGGYQLDMGDVGAALVGEVEKDKFVEAANNISEGTEPQF